MKPKLTLLMQELLLLTYELNRSGLLVENEEIQSQLKKLEVVLLRNLSPSSQRAGKD
ncbi:gpK [Enterobacteria phage NC6]|uniref:GpK n=4 Tax=Gequatrovirus TaxID=1910952 RepID=Q2LL93_9VIRU|nr:gpK [Escherichia phage ID52]AAZ49036.1 gpK [Escherichia phage ID52]AAZ49265.1 gpK [Enterobacteria phage ID8]AAZ49338.1 gpK [Enterobacteria phage ID12]AAZ49360.1 gpK [Enterobacteria phage NC6]